MEGIISILCDSSPLHFSSHLSRVSSIPVPFTTAPLFTLSSFLLRRDRDKRTRKRIYQLNYFIDIKLPSMTDETFRQHFRLRRSTFDGFMNFIGPLLQSDRYGRPQVDVTKQVLLSLWTLANLDCFREIADRFDLERGLGYRVFTRFILILYNSRGIFIRFPQGEELQRVETGFQNIRANNFPGTIGCVDGCQIEIPAPHTDKQSYYNRNKFFSVTLQGICDHRLLFLDAFAGYPGAAHDSNVWQHSPIFRRLLNENVINQNQHLLGDCAYPVSPFLMAPFKNNGHLNEIHNNFNQILSGTRVKVEQAFGLLKGRFRRLRKLEMRNLRLIPKVIICSCILHNICILNNDMIEYDDLYFIPFEAEDQNNDLEREGSEKRLALALQLHINIE